MWHRRIALGLALLALVLLAASGPGFRLGLWPFRFGFGMFAGSLIAAQGESYTVSFAGAPAGTYAFTCLPHMATGMHGKITVQ